MYNIVYDVLFIFLMFKLLWCDWCKKQPNAISNKPITNNKKSHKHINNNNIYILL